MEYYHQEVDVKHSDEAFDFLKECSLVVAKEGVVETLTVTEDLKAGHWFYPSRKNEENLTPMNPHLFVLTQSQNNLLICDKYLSARYIAKYAAGTEEKARVTLSAGKIRTKLKLLLERLRITKLQLCNTG